jgi:hypothetical protein
MSNSDIYGLAVGEFGSDFRQKQQNSDFLCNALAGSEAHSVEIGTLSPG